MSAGTDAQSWIQSSRCWRRTRTDTFIRCACEPLHHGADIDAIDDEYCLPPFGVPARFGEAALVWDNETPAAVSAAGLCVVDHTPGKYAQATTSTLPGQATRSCPERDSNPHVRSNAHLPGVRVYQFHHPGTYAANDGTR